MTSIPLSWMPLSIAALTLVPASSSASGPAPLQRLPADTALAIHIPRLGVLLRDLGALKVALSELEPKLQLLGPSGLIGRLLWDIGADEPEGVPHGLELDGPVILRLPSELSSAVVVLPVLDAARFRRWLRLLPAPSRTRVTNGHRTIEVLAPDSQRPLACAVEASFAVCQVGAPASDGLRPLLDHLEPRRRKLSDARGVAEAWSALPTSGSWRAIIRPTVLARAAASAWRRSLIHAHRLHTASVRAELERRTGRVQKSAVYHARLADAVAVALDTRVDGGKVDFVVQMSATGAERLNQWIPAALERPRMRRWVSTPALFSLFLRVSPSTGAHLAAAAGLRLPAAALDGTFGLLALGVNVRSPQARAGSGELDWAVLFPSAFALGLRPGGAKTAYESVARLLGSPAPRQARDPFDPRPAVEGPIRRSALTGQLDGRDVEVYVLEDILLGGAGLMAGRAALRRLRTASELAAVRSIPASIPPSGGGIPPGLAPPPGAALPNAGARSKPEGLGGGGPFARPLGFLQAVLDLEAIDAAWAAGMVDGEHRAELRIMDDMRQRLRPLMHQIRRIELSGRRVSDHQVRLELAFGR